MSKAKTKLMEYDALLFRFDTTVKDLGVRKLKLFKEPKTMRRELQIAKIDFALGEILLILTGKKEQDEE